MSEHKVIYLQPECCVDPFVGRMWCEDNVFEHDDDCEIKAPAVRYKLDELNGVSDE